MLENEQPKEILMQAKMDKRMISLYSENLACLEQVLGIAGFSNDMINNLTRELSVYYARRVIPEVLNSLRAVDCGNKVAPVTRSLSGIEKVLGRLEKYSPRELHSNFAFLTENKVAIKISKRSNLGILEGIDDEREIQEMFPGAKKSNSNFLRPSSTTDYYSKGKKYGTIPLNGRAYVVKKDQICSEVKVQLNKVLQKIDENLNLDDPLLPDRIGDHYDSIYLNEGFVYEDEATVGVEMISSGGGVFVLCRSQIFHFFLFNL